MMRAMFTLLTAVPYTRDGELVMFLLTSLCFWECLIFTLFKDIHLDMMG